MSDARLFLQEREAWEAERLRADRRARGSRAGTATVAGQTVTGVVLAESGVEYGVTFTVGEGGEITITMPLGYGVGGYGTTLMYG